MSILHPFGLDIWDILTEKRKMGEGAERNRKENRQEKREDERVYKHFMPTWMSLMSFLLFVLQIK